MKRAYILLTVLAFALIGALSAVIANSRGDLAAQQADESIDLDEKKDRRDEVSSGDEETVIAELGQPVMVMGITLMPLQVLEDSRCPSDVQCIWAGTVRLQIMTVDDMGTSTSEITPGTTVTTEARSITLVDVSPVPKSDVPITKAEYRFKFEVGYHSPAAQ
jgi:hypothetical protein